MASRCLPDVRSAFANNNRTGGSRGGCAVCRRGQRGNGLCARWPGFSRCRRPSACNTYFDTFGVALSFGDGSIAPFAHVQRLTATSRDCIKTAKAYLEHDDRSLAVQWVMAARIENARVREWLGSHPDAVLAALRHCCL